MDRSSKVRNDFVGPIWFVATCPSSLNPSTLLESKRVLPVILSRKYSFRIEGRRTRRLSGVYPELAEGPDSLRIVLLNLIVQP